ncbi:MAG: hypothetical protein ACLQVD_08545 [Capsulimonadaceae bacterium]
MLQAGGTGETSEVIRDRVVKSRELQKRRFERTTLQCNAHMASKQIKSGTNPASPGSYRDNKRRG